MRYLYIDKDRLALKQPCVAIRDEQGNCEYCSAVRIDGPSWLLAPIGNPLTPTGPAAWLETDSELTGSTLASHPRVTPSPAVPEAAGISLRCLIVTLSFALPLWVLIWSIVRWMAR